MTYNLLNPTVSYLAAATLLWILWKMVMLLYLLLYLHCWYVGLQCNGCLSTGAYNKLNFVSYATYDKLFTVVVCPLSRRWTGWWTGYQHSVCWCEQLVAVFCDALFVVPVCLHLTWHLRQSSRSRLRSWRSHRWHLLTWWLLSWQMLCGRAQRRYLILPSSCLCQ